MTFITRVTLNRSRSATAEIVSNFRKTHHLVEQCFSHDTRATFDDKSGRLLWRVSTSSYDPELLILSPLQPDVNHIVELAGRANDPLGVTTRSYDELIDALEVGSKRLFSIRANSANRIDRNTFVPHVTSKWISEWFREKAARSGFLVSESEIEVTEEHPVTSHKSHKLVTMSSSFVEGRLEVSDPDLLAHTIRNGFGRGKAYGFGLLAIAREQGS